MDNKIISIDTLRYYNDKISNYVDEKVSDTVDNLELGELNAILVDTNAEADDPIVPDYVTETELNTALSNKMDKVTLAKVATSGSYNDLSNKPTIPAAVTESTVSGWGFTKNTGTYSKPSGGIPKSDLASAVQTSLGKADTALQSYTEQYKGTITGVSANGTSVATSGVANIPAASTSAYGVTKLSSATNSTSTTLAATPSAVKAAYDLANSYKGTVTGVKINGTTKNPSSGVVDLGTVITSHQTLKTINGESIVGSGDITISGGGNSIDTISFTQPETILSNIESEKVYVGRVGLSSLTIQSFADNGSKHQEYTIVFYGGTYSIISLILPEEVLWANGEIPEIQPTVYYELSITRTLHGMTEKAYYKAVLTPFKPV